MDEFLKTYKWGVEALYSFLKTKSINLSKASICKCYQVWKYFMMRSQKQLIVHRPYRNAHQLKQRSRIPLSFRMFPFSFLFTENIITFCNRYKTNHSFVCPVLTTGDGTSISIRIAEELWLQKPIWWAHHCPGPCQMWSLTLNTPWLTWPETQPADLKMQVLHPESKLWIIPSLQTPIYAIPRSNWLLVLKPYGNIWFCSVLLCRPREAKSVPALFLDHHQPPWLSSPDICRIWPT